MTKQIGKLLHTFFVDKLDAKAFPAERLGGQRYYKYQFTLPSYHECGPLPGPLTYWINQNGRIKVGTELDNAKDLGCDAAKQYIKLAKAEVPFRHEKMATG